MASRSGNSLESPDVLVVGLGPTGIAALEAARATGARAAGVDRNSPRASGGVEGGHYGVHTWGIFSDGTVVLAGNAEQRRCTPRAIIVATGRLDIPLHLPGWHLPGVSGAHTSTSFLAEGTNVVVIRGPHAGMGDRHPKLDHLQVLRDYDLADGAPVTIMGSGHVEAIQVGDERISVQHVLLDNGLQPENMLARMIGLPTTFSTAAGGDAIQVGSVIAAERALLSVVGDACGIHPDRDATIHAARETGRALAESVIGGRIPTSLVADRESWPDGGPPLLPIQITNDTLVCPDEGITVSMVRDAIARGATTVNDVKRRTRAAMAVCQGRDCLWAIRALLAQSGRDWRTPMTARPPAAGISLDDLAAIAVS